MSYKKLLAVLPCAALWAALPPKARAQEQEQAPQPQAQSQGMVVVRDRQTGQLRAPTAAEARALAPVSARMSAPAQPAVVTHPGGSRQVRLGERGLVYSVLTRGADGKLVEQCVKDAAVADQLVLDSTPVSTPAAARHEGHRHD